MQSQRARHPGLYPAADRRYNTLDALSNRPMMQLKYRNFDAFEAMVFNQTIDVSGSIPFVLGFTPAEEVAGIRWYELRKSGDTGPSISRARLRRSPWAQRPRTSCCTAGWAVRR